MRKRTLNNQGVALVTVVLFFLVLVILLGGVMFSSISNQKNAMLSKEHSSAYYVAESGLNVTMERLNKFLIDNNYEKMTKNFSVAMEELDDFIMSEGLFISNGLNGSTGNLVGTTPNGEYKIISEKDIISNKYTIKREREVDGVLRTLTTELQFIENKIDLMKAVYVKDSLDLKSVTLTGDIASLTGNISIDSKIKCGIDRIYVPFGTALPLKDDKNKTLDLSRSTCTPPEPDIDVILFDNSEIVFEPIRIDDFYPNQPNTDGLDYEAKEELLKTTITPKPLTSELMPLTTSGANNFTFPNLGTKKAYSLDTFSGDLTFNLGTDKTKVYKVFLSDSIIHNGTISKKITVNGEGKLQIFITLNNSNDVNKSSLEFLVNSVISGKDSLGNVDLSQLQFIVDTVSSLNGSTISIPSNSTVFTGSIIADKINFEIKNTNFKGFIGTNGTSFEMSTGGNLLEGPAWIYAPNATFSLKSADIQGAVIAKTANFKTGGGELSYKLFSSTLPGDMTLPMFEGGKPITVGITVKFINFKEV